MTILDQLADHARKRVAAYKAILPLEEVRRQCEALPKGSFALDAALAKPGLSFIGECKKVSPSKGLIAPDFPYLQIAREYEAAGADAISVLTEPKWFLSSDNYLREIAQTVAIPCLRKDFTVDEYMIYQARLLGASAVLLICSILSDAQLNEYLALCRALGLSALVEAHDKAEVERALASGAAIICVNNRNLKDFTVDTANSRPYFLAGGLGPETVTAALNALHPYGVDVSSGIETDHKKMAAFVAAVRRGDALRGRALHLHLRRNRGGRSDSARPAL